MAQKKNLHINHRQRVRNKFKENGLEGFADHEVLELLLFYAIPRQDTNEIAHRMIDSFGSLHNLMDADVEEIMKVCGTTENVAVLISMMPHIAKRYKLNKAGEKVLLDSTRKAGEYCKHLYLGKTVECFYMLCLDSKHKLIAPVLLEEGTHTEVHYYSRRIVELALKHQAVSVIITHNHPSGDTTPSKEDMEATKDMRDVLSVIDINLVDHIIIGGNDYMSFSEKGLLHLEY